MEEKLKAGEYYVGDLCYVLDGNGYEWHRILDMVNYFMDGEVFEITVFNEDMGREVTIRGFCSSTMYGDGSYHDQHGNRYHVDAGIIGCVHREALPEVLTNESHKGGQFINFGEDFTCESAQDNDDEGVIRIGHLLIDTN